MLSTANLHPYTEETTTNKRMCKMLIEKWSRPVYELSSHYRDLPQDMRPREEEDMEEER